MVGSNDTALRSRRAKENNQTPDHWAPLVKALSNPWSRTNTEGTILHRGEHTHAVESQPGGLMYRADISPASRDTRGLLEKERLLAEACLRRGVMIARGGNFMAEEFGWFRITFTAQREALLEGLRRVVAALGDVER